MRELTVLFNDHAKTDEPVPIFVNWDDIQVVELLPFDVIVNSPFKEREKDYYTVIFHLKGGNVIGGLAVKKCDVPKLRFELGIPIGSSTLDAIPRDFVQGERFTGGPNPNFTTVLS